MSNFIIGKTYKDQNGLEYTFLNEQNGIATFQFRNVQKKLRIIDNFGSISLACSLRNSN